MSAVQTEQVMVVKTELFRQLGYFEGFCTDSEIYLETLFDAANTQYLARGDMETDPSYKQLIPYCIFQHIDEDGNIAVFQYTRGSGSGESRLRSKKSIGIGGHISTLDADEKSPYLVGMQRELDEEIAIDTEYQQSLVGLINDDSNEVGQVHLGIVHQFTVESKDIRALEDDIAEASFCPIEDIMADLESYETWSQLCLKGLYGNW